MKIPYIDWGLVAERGLPPFFIDLEVYGDYSEISELSYAKRTLRVKKAINETLVME